MWRHRHKSIRAGHVVFWLWRQAWSSRVSSSVSPAPTQLFVSDSMEISCRINFPDANKNLSDTLNYEVNDIVSLLLIEGQIET